VRTEDLDDSTRATVIDVCIEAHGLDDFRNLFTHIPGGGRHVLAYDGSALVGHAVATTRWLQPAGLQMLKTAYVDAVSTSPAHQGMGVGSSVMRRLANDANVDHDIACLDTDKVGFYAPLGWRVWRGPLAGRGPNGLVPTPDQRWIMVLALTRTPTLDLDAMLTIEMQPGRIW
jgi:aminoglycoside 2'-N-acetyltransferase I